MDTNQSSEQYLRELYYNPDSPVAYSSLNKIWKQVKEDGKLIKQKEVKEFLETLPTHQLHKLAINGNILIFCFVFLWAVRPLPGQCT